MRSAFVVSLGVSVGLVLGSAVEGHAQRGGQRAIGVITDLDLLRDAPSLRVELDSGRTATLRVERWTRVTLSGDLARRRPDPSLEDLERGMRVAFEWPEDRDGVVKRLQVLEADDRGGRDRDEDRSSSSRGEELKVRLLDINGRRGEFVADVAGRRRQFVAEDAGMLRGFEEGDLAIISVRRQGSRSVVVEIRSASVRGRVVDVDERRGEIVVSVDGRETAYGVDNPRLLHQARRGERIRFEFEDRRNGRKVITEIF